MRIKFLFSALLVVGVLFMGGSGEVSAAAGLKVQPLSYRDTLQQGEKKKGFIDVSNPTDQKLRLVTSVQAFRQINDQGGLEFYDDPLVAAGITPDFTSFELGPRQALRLYFLLDGTKLPPGDVFGALFVSSRPVGDSSRQTGSATAVRVGTLFSLVNGTAPLRSAEIRDISVDFWQGSTIEGVYRIANTAAADSSSGFYPEVTVESWPIGPNMKVVSSLVFAGRERTNGFSLASVPPGLQRITVGYGDSRMHQWVLSVPWWWPFVLVAAIVAGAAGWLWRTRRRNIGHKGMQLRR